MNVVLYTRDMEPITVIDLPLWALEQGEKLNHIQVAVMDPVPLPGPGERALVDRMMARSVTLEFTPIRLGYKRSWLVIVNDDVLALKLTPSWLPGQRAKINQYESETKKLAGMLLDVLSRGVGGH